jgi:hypothetical protein
MYPLDLPSKLRVPVESDGTQQPDSQAMVAPVCDLSTLPGSEEAGFARICDDLISTYVTYPSQDDDSDGNWHEGRPSGTWLNPWVSILPI